MGVRVALVAGWEVADAAARLFAETCYRALLTGSTFGAAVLQARQDTWRLYPNSNTWGRTNVMVIQTIAWYKSLV